MFISQQKEAALFNIYLVNTPTEDSGTNKKQFGNEHRSTTTTYKTMQAEPSRHSHKFWNQLL
jgi:hypothetical protein